MGIESPSVKRWETTVNGISIVVHYSPDYYEYIITFPQIVLDESANEKGVVDQVIRVSEDADVAKSVFDKVSEMAETEADVYNLYKLTEDYLKTINRYE